MIHGFDALLCTLAAAWILVAGLARLFRRRPQGVARPEPPVRPSGAGLEDLERLLASSATRGYSRDQIQERLRLLAEDLQTLGEDPRSGDPLLEAYFAEDHVGFRGANRARATQGADFLMQTEAVVRRMEGRSLDEGACP